MLLHLKNPLVPDDPLENLAQDSFGEFFPTLGLPALFVSYGRALSVLYRLDQSTLDPIFILEAGAVGAFPL